MQHYFYERADECILGNLGNNGCHYCYFFPISRKGFFDVLQHTNIMRYNLHFFSLHLINFKGVIGVLVAMAPIFFVLEHGVTRIFGKQVIYVILTSLEISSTHIYILLKVVFGNL